MRIVRHVSRVLEGRGNYPPLSLGMVSETNAGLVRLHTGFDIAGYERVLETSDIRHVIASHGNAEKEAARGQAAIVKADFARIGAVAEQAHSIRLVGIARSLKPRRLTYNAIVDGSEYEYVEEVRAAKRIVALKTMWKRPVGGGAQSE